MRYAGFGKRLWLLCRSGAARNGRAGAACRGIHPSEIGLSVTPLACVVWHVCAIEDVHAKPQDAVRVAIVTWGRLVHISSTLCSGCIVYAIWWPWIISCEHLLQAPVVSLAANLASMRSDRTVEVSAGTASPMMTEALISHSQLLQNLERQSAESSLKLLPLSEEALAVWARVRCHDRGLDSLPRLRMQAQPDSSAITHHLMLIEVRPCLMSVYTYWHAIHRSDEDGTLAQFQCSAQLIACTHDSSDLHNTKHQIISPILDVTWALWRRARITVVITRRALAALTQRC